MPTPLLALNAFLLTNYRAPAELWGRVAIQLRRRGSYDTAALAEEMARYPDWGPMTRLPGGQPVRVPFQFRSWSTEPDGRRTPDTAKPKE